MRIPDQRKQEIVASFQRSFKRDNKDEIVAIPLTELRQADEMPANRDLNAGFRVAIRNRIKELEDTERKNEQRRYERKVRIWNLITGIIIGLVIAGLATWLFG